MTTSDAQTCLRCARWVLPMLLVVLPLVLAAPGPQESSGAKDSNGPMYVIAHVDIVPNHKDDGMKLLKDFEAESRKDQGVVRFEVVEEYARANHFTILEVWRNRAAYEAHVTSDHTKRFREALYPMLGSPYDERLNHEF